MAHTAELVRQSLDELLDTLDAGNDDSLGANRRRRLRRNFRTPCDVSCLAGAGEITTAPGMTRNISFRGIGLISSVRPAMGHPIELSIPVTDRATTYLAGTVAFCRGVAQAHFEIGVAVHTAGTSPIFRDDPASAASRLEWLAEALASLPAD